MGRVINNSTPAKSRNRYRRAIAEILRHLSQKPALDEETKDMAAMIVFLLREIDSGVEQTISAWEKRGYWLKADRFRLQWEWAGQMSASLEKALRADDWGAIAMNCVKLGEKVADIKLPKKPRIGQPWDGAWEKLQTG
ncbi:MAG: hypothetical protein R3272_10560 [Candidatus Promineifilaceae bacterium]|nr:hypothetical protein [Candidatus Promineifilaceae bacterium]